MATNEPKHTWPLNVAEQLSEERLMLLTELSAIEAVALPDSIRQSADCAGRNVQDHRHLMGRT